MSLELALEEYQDVVVVALDGVVQPSNAAFLRNSLKTLARDGYFRFVLDCTQLRSVNSDGLSILYDMFLSLPPDGKIVLCNANQNIRTLLDISGLGHYLHCVENRDAAMQTLRDSKYSE